MKRGLVLALCSCFACASGTSDDPGVTSDAPVVPIDATVDATRAIDATVDATGAIDAAIDAAPAPPMIAFTGDNRTAQFGGSGGATYVDACPGGQALIGFTGSLTSATGYHGQLSSQCGAVTLVDNAGSYSVRVTSGATLATRGILSGSAWARTCAADQVIVGFRGRSGNLVDQLTFRCAPLIATFAGTWTITVGSTSDLEAIGGNGGNAFAQTDCPAGQVATIAPVRAGDGIDAFGLGCSTPIVVQ